MNKWLPIESAPRDGTVIIGLYSFDSLLAEDGAAKSGVPEEIIIQFAKKEEWKNGLWIKWESGLFIVEPDLGWRPSRCAEHYLVR